MSKEKNNDYITIGEITMAVDITRQGIYFYEAKGLIKPVMKAGRIRLYTPDTIDKVKKIKELSKTYKLEAIVKMVEEGEL